mmetsp:Transcript_137086/g.292796  ORF Transcript_137086/g.292796 Transcript_137086/m.292796 type:complete len:210 (+) Transcript_137086:690-1319(+)
MVAVHVLDKGHHVTTELRSDCQLRLPGHVLDGCLNDPATLNILGELQHVGLELESKRLLLCCSAALEIFLYHKVAEAITCQLPSLGQDGLEDGLTLRGRRLIQLPLQEATALLVLRELQELEHDLAKGELALCGALLPNFSEELATAPDLLRSLSWGASPLPALGPTTTATLPGLCYALAGTCSAERRGALTPLALGLGRAAPHRRGDG